MKVDPALARPAQAPAHPVGAEGGQSFTQLIEAGGSADAVTASRALGFAETGVLGVHSALLNDPAAASAPDGAAAQASAPGRPQRFAPWSGPALVSVAELLAQTPGQVPALAAPATASPAGIAPAATAPQAATLAAAPAPVATTVQTLAFDQSEPDTPAPRRAVWLRQAEPERPAGQVRFELHGLDEHVIAVVTDMPFDALDERDLAQINDCLSKEFGVTVGRIVLRPKHLFPTGNQRGN